MIVYPTDTVYGLGCDAASEEGIERVHQIKGISGRKPFSVMMADFGMIDEYCETGLWEDIILNRFLPGPYTFILKSNGLCKAAQNGKLGVRIPDSVFCQELCIRLGRPIITTSANVSGKPAPTRYEDIDRAVLEKAGIAVDGGQTKYKSPSVIIDLVERKMLREGSKEIDLADLDIGSSDR